MASRAAASSRFFASGFFGMGPNIAQKTDC